MVQMHTAVHFTFYSMKTGGTKEGPMVKSPMTVSTKKVLKEIWAPAIY